VVAAGQAYVVHAGTAGLEDTFGADIGAVLETQVPRALVLVGSTDLKIIEAGGRWNTPRLSWDGFDGVHVEGSRILGEAWEPGDDVFQPFVVDLLSRRVEGGSYPREHSE
jgi:hypothetical protein